MKKITLLIISAAFILSCNTPSSRNSQQPNQSDKAVIVYSVDELYSQAGELTGKEITVQGTVMHVCKQGGGRCFLMGSNENINIRVEAGEAIGAFSQEQMGSDLTVNGILKEVKSAADMHNPAQEHGDAEHAGDAETEEAHQIIAQSEQQVETVYFLEGLQVVNVAD